jgi:hypothetical protein
MFAPASDPARLPTERLEHEIAQLAAHIYAATCRWLELVAEFDRRECHLSLGFHSCTAWLSWTCGITTRAAREHVRVARDLARLPLIRAAFGRGEISYSKVRAVTRIAEPETEDELLELAQNATAAQLERSVRAYRSAVAVTEGGPPADTYLAWAWEDDGTLSVRGRLAPDEGALFIEAIQQGRRVAWGDRGPAVVTGDGAPEPAVTNTDALAAVAEASLTATGSSTGGDRHQVVIHVDAEGRSELEDGSSVDTETARRMLCDASMIPVAEAENEVLSVGRRSRTVPAAIGRAVRLRDGGCRFPGCTHHRFVDRHHIEHWAEGGETSVDNLVQLCRRHHRLVHEGGFAVNRSDRGELAFLRPDGSVFEAQPPRVRGDTNAIARPARRGPPRLATGDPLDLDLTVESIVSVSRRIPSGDVRGALARAP